MPLRRRHTDENNRPPWTRGDFRGWCDRNLPKLPLTPSLCKEGGVIFREVFHAAARRHDLRMIRRPRLFFEDENEDDFQWRLSWNLSARR